MKGKLALITGATSGIGLGIAKKMASLGVKLAYNGKVQSQKEINELKNLYKETYKTDTFYENADVSNMGEMQSFYENVIILIKSKNYFMKFIGSKVF